MCMHYLRCGDALLYSAAARAPFLSKLDPSISATIALLNTSSCSRACSATLNPKSSFGPTRVTRRENGVPCVAISSTAPKTKKYLHHRQDYPRGYTCNG